MTIDWNGAVLTYCQKAYGNERGETIKDKLWYLENRSFFAMHGFTALGWFKDSYPKTKLTGALKANILTEMRFGETALDEIIATAEFLKTELRSEIVKLETEG